MISAQPSASAVPLLCPPSIEEQKREVLERAIVENEDLLLRWVGRLLGSMNVYERSRGRSRGDIAGDVLADACLAVLRNAGRFELGRDPLPWIKTFAAFAAKRHREQVFGANKAHSERREVLASEIAGEDQGAEEALESHAATHALSLGMLDSRRPTPLETEQALGSLLEPLNEGERRVIVLSVFGGYDSAALAEALGIAPPAARKRLQRALDRLRAHIASHSSEFDWIEDLPALLRSRDRDRNGAASAIPQVLEEPGALRNSASAPCHSNAASSQQHAHDSHDTSRPSFGARDAARDGASSARSRSNAMISPAQDGSLAHAAPKGDHST